VKKILFQISQMPSNLRVNVFFVFFSISLIDFNFFVGTATGTMPTLLVSLGQLLEAPTNSFHLLTRKVSNAKLFLLGSVLDLYGSVYIGIDFQNSWCKF
jgi:hypothetical protein